VASMMQGGDLGRRPMAEINIVPLVDVILVLLIIFMVTAPLLQGGLDLKLPKASSTGLDTHEGIVLDVTADGSMRVGEKPVTLDDLEAALAEAGADQKPVMVRADTRVPYGTVARILGRVRHAGVTDVGLITEPEETVSGRRR
jgi:biopolymer transport protein ExbD